MRQHYISKPFFRLLTSLFLVSGFLLTCPMEGLTAKKKGGASADDKAVEKALKPITLDMDKLLLKTDGRFLFSPAEAQKLLTIKFQLMDLMDQYPTNKLMLKPVYQFGVLLSSREEYSDAVILLNFVAEGFPTTSYGIRAKSQLKQLEKYSDTDRVSNSDNSKTLENPSKNPESVK